MQRYWQFWAIGLTVALILLGQFLTAGAQTGKSKITTNGADDTFEPTLAQPAKFLQSLGITPEQVQQKLKPRSHILVVGAGFVRNLGLAVFASIKNAQLIKSSIHVEGAGATRVIGLVAFTEIQNSQPFTPAIQVVGASSVRAIDLIVLPVQ